ncbi:iron-sulfur cluster assembly scaffold protein [Novosphingobium sp. 1949]|uniref:Iron-sulfur cluster assembly scaffold protein n=1 Tax=Novosphingobium organovorum TaxID=2930092 RepID=A0ABT0BA60_9SPHN|nr:iron-sulfur cluster assembly scaffold protein [Novosphingobium organovorum]MCJ2181898.1 iron-sulfur cluster assembly scaffold protein [Novosphingobium organovorum]
MSATVLYTPEILGLAVELAALSLDEGLALTGEARSPTCGSQLRLGLACDDAGRIERVGVACQACAIGQASAAVFARGAIGRGQAAIAEARGAITAWLGGAGDLPEWPGFAALAAVKDYPGRHGALVLAWDAALKALSSAAPAR